MEYLPMGRKPSYEELLKTIKGLEREILMHDQAEESLKKSNSEQWFRKIYEESPIGIELYDSKGRLLSVNKACLDIFGVIDEKELKDFALLEDPNVTDEAKVKLSRGNLVRYETSFNFDKVKDSNLYKTTKSGISYLDVVIAPLGIKDRSSPTGYLVQVQDNSQRKRAEQELQKAHDLLEQKVKERTEELARTNQNLLQEITDHKRTGEALCESEERYRLLIVKMLNCFALLEIITDKSGQPCDYRFLEVNESFERITGLKASEIVGKTVLEVLPEIESYWLENFKHVAITTEPRCFDHYTRVFGKYFEVLTYCPKKGQLAVVFTDITERKKIEETLRFTQFAIDKSSDAAYWVGADGRFFYVNDASCRVLGYSKEQLLKMSVQDINPDYSPELWAKHWSHIKRKGYLFFESYQRTSEGITFPAEIAANFLEFRGREYNCFFVRDISKRKRLEEERGKLESKLRQAHRMQAVATLAGGIAHQFNNALAGISMSSDLLEINLPADQSIIRRLDQIRQEIHRMTQLTSQLLGYAREGKFQPKIISSRDLVIDTLPLIQHSLHPRVVVDTILPQDISPIMADRTQMQMVLAAIIQNAFEAIEADGHITISSKNEEIDTPFADNHPGLEPGSYISLTIEDDGAGMDEETRNRVFEPFFTNKFQGRGLGMAAVYGIVKNHGGYIWVDSELGKGTTVCILLPATEKR
jgi:PAS domain S-box-containing protein